MKFSHLNLLELVIKMRIILVLIGICYILPARSQRRQQGWAWPRRTQQWQTQICNTPDNFIGVCVTLPNCPSVVNLYGATGGSPQSIEYLKGIQRNCGTRSIRGQPVVCCMEAYRGPQRMTTRAPVFSTEFVPTFEPTFTSVITYPTQPPIDPTTSIATFAPTIPTTSPTTSTSTFTTTQLPPNPTTSTTYLPPTSEKLAQSDCNGPDNKEGVCKDLAQCPVLLEHLRKNQGDANYVSFLRKSNELCKKPTPVVCCPFDESEPIVISPDQSTEGSVVTPTELSTRLLTPEEGCGRSNNTNTKIVGGTTAKLGAYPWIALLGYDDPLGSFGDSPFKCGGALITRNHVLTAAHCIRRDLTFVRLGEHDLTTDTETKHVDVKIIKTAQHSAYSRTDGHSDIAILYLEKPVTFTDLIKPVCLPLSSKLRTRSFVDYNPFVAGWGKTMEGGQSANILQELQIPVHENTVCRNSYARQNRWISYKQFDDAVLCAGVLTGGKDTCQGDSGGPLMTPELINGKYIFYEIGIVSYGVGCARPDIPGVYTNVGHFMDWIEEKVADTS